jgi:hypothetical protein
MLYSLQECSLYLGSVRIFVNVFFDRSTNTFGEMQDK